MEMHKNVMTPKPRLYDGCKLEKQIHLGQILTQLPFLRLFLVLLQPDCSSIQDEPLLLCPACCRIHKKKTWHPRHAWKPIISPPCGYAGLPSHFHACFLQLLQPVDCEKNRSLSFMHACTRTLPIWKPLYLLCVSVTHIDVCGVRHSGRELTSDHATTRGCNIPWPKQLGLCMSFRANLLDIALLCFDISMICRC